MNVATTADRVTDDVAERVGDRCDGHLRTSRTTTTVNGGSDHADHERRERSLDEFMTFIQLTPSDAIVTTHKCSAFGSGWQPGSTTTTGQVFGVAERSTC